MRSKTHCLFHSLLCGLLVVTASCSVRSEQQVVARVFDKYLYLDELSHMFSEQTSDQDSVALARLFIESWIKTQLLLNKAEINLALDQIAIEKEIEAYRTALLIHRYKEAMVNAKLDTVVSDSDILDYYQNNLSNFVQTEDLVKGIFLKFPVDAPNQDKVRIWIASSSDEDIQELDNYCYTFATKYDYFDDDWIPFSVIRSELPEDVDPVPGYLNSSKLIAQSDSLFGYLVYVKEALYRGETAPLGQVRHRVRDIIINKRKVKLLSDIENELYMDALQRKRFEIYEFSKE